MRFIRFALLSFIILFLVVTGISLLVPSHIRISKAINIKGDRDSIMAQIRNPSQWKNWYPGMDSVTLYYQSGEVKGVLLDNKDSIHTASLTITHSQPDEVTAEWVTQSMRPVKNGWKTINYSTTDSVTLQWYMDFHLRWYPWEKFRSLLLESSYGARMEKGLTNLRNIVQSR